LFAVNLVCVLDPHGHSPSLIFSTVIESKYAPNIDTS
jgi:hypothetical protein